MSSKLINWDEQPLGQVPDRVLAEELGVNKNMVFRARKRRDIKPCGFHSKVHKRVDFDWGEQPLGELPDEALGRKLGVSGNAVKYQRIKRGIPVYQKTEYCPVCGEAVLVFDTRRKVGIPLRILRAVALIDHVREAHQSVMETIEE